MQEDTDETFSYIDLIVQCLTDEKRTLLFQQAIETAVKPGDVVLDSGTGSSVLALFAARAGAKKVIAVEFDPYAAKLARENVARNGFADTVETIEGDIRRLSFDDGVRFDVVLMEMLTTGMVDEYQVQAINHLHSRGLVKESTIFIPKRQDTFVALAEMDYRMYGLTMRMARHLWEDSPTPQLKCLTNTKLLSSISFEKQNPTTFQETIRFEVQQSGTLNSVYLTSETILDDATKVGATAALNAPVVMPLEEDYMVSVGDSIECTISYQFGNGYRNFKADIRVL